MPARRQACRYARRSISALMRRAPSLRAAGDVAVVVAYGLMILPQAVLDAPRLGC